MFGDNTNDSANSQQPFAGDQPALNAPVSSSAPTMSAPAIPSTSEQPDTAATTPPAADTNTQTEVTTYGAPAVSAPPADNASPTSVVSTNSGPTVGGSDDLLDIKQQALQQLTPLVDHLDQTPQEEFRTTMMMIQATDNQELVKKAFEAAKKIEDDKERAQAFLDIINEINYFTQHHEQQ